MVNDAGREEGGKGREGGREWEGERGREGCKREIE